MSHKRLDKAFKNWKDSVDQLTNPSVEELLHLFKKHKVEFPRIVVPAHSISIKSVQG